MTIAKHIRFITIGVVAAVGGAAIALWMPVRVMPHGWGLWALLLFAVIMGLLSEIIRKRRR